MDLDSSLRSELEAANSPEEAYKLFCASASKGLGELLAKAIADAVGGASSFGSNNAKIAGWEKYVKGVTLSGCWGTPGVLSPPSSVNTFADSDAPSLLGGRVTIGGEWQFWQPEYLPLLV